MKVEAKRNMLSDFSITITNDNFSNYFSEKPKTEIEILKEQLLEVQELIVENEYNSLITEQIQKGFDEQCYLKYYKT